LVTVPLRMVVLGVLLVLELLGVLLVLGVLGVQWGWEWRRGLRLDTRGPSWLGAHPIGANPQRPFSLSNGLRLHPLPQRDQWQGATSRQSRRCHLLLPGSKPQLQHLLSGCSEQAALVDDGN